MSLATTAALAVAAPVATADPEPSLAEVEQRVSQLERQSAEATERYHQVTERVSSGRRELVALQARLDRERQRLEEMAVQAGRLAAATYTSGGIDEGMTFLFAEDPGAALDGMAHLQHVSRRQSAVIDRTEAAARAAEAARTAAQDQLREVQALERQVAQESRTARSKLDEARGVLERLEAEERARLEAARQAAAQRAATAARASRSGREDAVAPGAPVAASGAAAVAVETALAQVGDRYVHAGNGPDAFDCSGLTSFAWRAAGVSLPRSSRAQYAAGRKVGKGDLQPGDLVYFYSPISHVGIYLGGGKIVHAANPRSGVNVTSLDSMPFAGATRP